MSSRKIIATSALIYANGPLHLGHLVEYIQTDIWVRFQKMSGVTCHYICGSDAHGAPIMLRAEKEGITPEALINRIYQEHQKDFADFHIAFDEFYTTHSEENRELVYDIYHKLNKVGAIVTRTITQLYDPEKNMFLPDRFIKGTCPRCQAADQYGDNCEICGATYSPTDLKNPRSVVSGATPILKESEHYFFDLPRFEGFLKEWSQSDHLQKTVTNKLDEWFKAGLQAWDISRDAPYFGFEIPGNPNKYFYVWLDAPVGYIASFKHFCDKNPSINFDEYWKKESTTELHHFIGKDIMYFHALFWPAMLEGADYRTPTAINTHGFLTVNGQKMSKSRGTFIKGRTYLNHLNPEYLRYYYASKLASSNEDIDLNFEDFRLRVNSDLVGKYINIASRCAGFIHKLFGGKLAAEISEPDLISQFVNASEIISDYYEKLEFNPAMREIMRLADIANQYIAEKAPWTLAKDPEKLAEVHAICTMGLNLFHILTVYLKPVLPALAKEVEVFLNIPTLQWEHIASPLISHSINIFKPLMQRIEETQLAALQDATKHESY